MQAFKGVSFGCCLGLRCSYFILLNGGMHGNSYGQS